MTSPSAPLPAHHRRRRRPGRPGSARAGNGSMAVLTAAGRSACLFPPGVGRVAVIKASYPPLSVICLGLADVVGRWPVGMAAAAGPAPEISGRSREYSRRPTDGRTDRWLRVILCKLVFISAQSLLMRNSIF